MMGLKSKKSHLSQSSSSFSLAGSLTTGSFSVVSRRGYNNPSSSTLSLSSSTVDSNQPTQCSDKEKEREKSMTKISGFFSSSKKGKGKEKAAVQSSSSPMLPKTDVTVLETMSSSVIPSTVSEPTLVSSSESSSQGQSRLATVKSVAEQPRQPLFVANPDPTPEIPSAEPLFFSTSESSSSVASGYTSQVSYAESDISVMKKGKDPLILTFDPSTSTRLTLAASRGVLLDAVPLSHPEEDPPAYTPHPQPQSHSTSPSGPHSESSTLPSELVATARLRLKKTLTKPAPLRHISVPALPTQERPHLPSRAISVPDAEFIMQNGKETGQGLDRIDELDESSPYGVNLHLGGPFDVTRVIGNDVSSSKPSHVQSGFLDPVTTIPYNPFGIPKGGLQVGQVIPRNFPSSQSQNIRQQKRPSYTNHHLQPGLSSGLDRSQNRMSTLSSMSSLPSPGWPLPSPGFPDNEENRSTKLSVPVTAESISPSNAGGSVASSSSSLSLSTRPGHISETSYSSTVSGASSYHTAPHKPPHQWNAYHTPSPSNETFPSNTQTPSTPGSANWNTTVYGGIESDNRANVRQSQINLALGSPLYESSMDSHGHRKASIGMTHITEEEEGKEEEGTEGVGMAILREDSSDEEEAQPVTAARSKAEAEDDPAINDKHNLSQAPEIRDEDYEYWSGSSGPHIHPYHKQSYGYDPAQIAPNSSKGGWTHTSGDDELQCHSPYSLLDDKDAVERFGGPPSLTVNNRKLSHSFSEGLASRAHDGEASGRTVNGALMATATRSSSLAPTPRTHPEATNSHPVLGTQPPHLRSHPTGFPQPPQQRSQTMYVPNGHNPPLLSIPPAQSCSPQPSPTGSPYHSKSHSPNRSPIAPHLYPAHMQFHHPRQLEGASSNPNKHHSLPSPASPDWIPRETWASKGHNDEHINASQNGLYSPSNVNGVAPTGVNGHLNRYSQHQKDLTSSTMRSMSLPPSAVPPAPNHYQRQAPPPPARFTPPSQSPHLNANSDMPPVSLNRPRHAPTKLVMPAPLQGQGPPLRPRSPYHSNGPSIASKYPPPPPIPPTANGSAGKLLRKRSSIANTASPSTRPTNGGDEWGYVNTSGYASEGGVGRSKTIQPKKTPKRVLSKRRVDL